MSNHNHHDTGTRGFMNKIAFLDSAIRKNTLSPEVMLSMLPIQEHATILDVGAGSGYLTLPVAMHTAGTVFALDMDERMLGLIDAKAKAEKITNIQLIQDNVENMPLPDNAVDIILASLILHEVSSLQTALSQFGRVLKSGGYLLCLEYEKEEHTTQGPPKHIRISSAEMEQALILVGFHIVHKKFPGESMYIVIAKK